MKRHSSIIPLSQDHHHGLILAQLLKPDSPAYKGLPADAEGKSRYALNAWENELKIHFKNEEEILFPAVGGRSDELDKVINEVLEEHKELEDLFKKLDSDEVNEETLHKIGYKLEAHIRKEERELFELIQKVFTGEELDKLNGLITPVKSNDSKSC